MGDKKPNNILIVGQTRCGKTYYLLSMLENEYFNHIFLICPTFSFNKSYLDWKFINDPNLFAIQCNHDEVNTWLKQLKSIAKPFRENITKLVCFYNPNKKDVQNLFNDYLGEISKGEQKNKIWEKLRNNKYARLQISLRHPFNYAVKIKE